MRFDDMYPSLLWGDESGGRAVIPFRFHLYAKLSEPKFVRLDLRSPQGGQSNESV